MYNKELITKRFAHSLHSYNRLATVQQSIASKLADQLRSILPAPGQITEIGSGTGFLTNHLTVNYPKAQITAIDIVAESQTFLPKTITFITADGETTPIAPDQNLIASSSTVQWFDDLPLFITRATQSLAPRGVIAISTFGPRNFLEIAATTNQTLAYYTLEQLAHLFEPLHIEYSEQWIETLEFNDPSDVLRHLKATGVNALTPTHWTKSRLQQFHNDYLHKFGSATLTFHPQIIIARKNG